MFQFIKFLVRFFRLQRFSFGLIQFFALFKSKFVINRNGLTYEVDLTKVIDFDIFRDSWEVDTINFLLKSVNQNDIVIEVGANIGAHTLTIAKLVGPTGTVFAFEPTEFALKKLRKNLSLNKSINNVVIVDSLVSNETGFLKHVKINSNWSLNGDQDAEDLYDKIVTTIDQFVKDNNLIRVDLLKIDVDGFDYKVLSGSRDTLTKFKPIIFCELCEYALNNQNDSVRDIFNFLHGLGYEGFDVINGSILTASQVLDNIKLEKSINAIFRYKDN